MKKSKLGVVGAILLGLCVPLEGLRPAEAQITTASLRGPVKDESGSVLPGVTVTATDDGTGRVRTTVTDARGEYRLTGLPPGTYTLAAELDGFRRFVQSGIILSVGQEVVIGPTLAVGDLSEVIDVKAAAPILDTSSGTLSGLMEGEAIRTLPLNARSFEQLALLSPGVTTFAYGGANVQNGLGVQMSLSGARPDATYYMLDGTNILDHSNYTPGSAAGNNLGVDAIREFRVFTHNYSSELGVRAGGAVSVITKSGTNTFSGSAFEFHRNDKLDARNYFDTGEKPPFHRNQFGFSLGGPIVRNKTFFFTNLEWLREELGRTLISVVPTALARQGVLPDITVNVNPAVRPYLDLYPLPNGRDLGDGTGEYISTFQQPTNEDYLMARVDQNLSTKDTLFVRYVRDRASVTSPRVDMARFVQIFDSDTDLFTVQETRVLSQRLLNEFKFAYNHTSPAELSEARPEVDPSLKFFDHALHVGELSFSTGRGTGEGAAISSVGVGGNAPRVFTQNIWQFSNMLTHQVGRHAFKYGVDVQRLHLDGLLNNDTNGRYSFTGLVNLLRGTPNGLLAPAPGGDPLRRYRQWMVGSFIQDDIQLRSNLTLNVGLRHEFTSIPDEVDGKISNFRNVTDPAPEIGFVLAKNNSLKNFAPRVGFAWDLRGDSRMSVRGGFGVFHSQVIGRNYYTYLARQTPFGVLVVDQNPLFPHPFDRPIAPGVQQNDMIDPNLKTPTMYHYNLTFQRQIATTWMAEAAYVGSRGVNLLRNYEGNTRIPQVLADGRLFYPPGAPFTNPNFGSIFVLTSDAHSWYDSMQLRLNKQLSGGLRFQTSYTWGKSLDEASALQRGQSRNSATFTQNPHDPGADKGLSSFHVAHAFTLSGTYAVPAPEMGIFGRALLHGWQVGGILRLQTGTPFNAETGFNRSNDGSATPGDRPNLRPGASNNPVLGGADRYFDPTVFELPPPGFYGNVGRNTLIGPGLAVLDLLAARQFRLRGGSVLAFRFEVFNATNRVNFSFPRNRIFSSNGSIPAAVGRITATTTSARQIQLGVKLTF